MAEKTKESPLPERPTKESAETAKRGSKPKGSRSTDRTWMTGTATPSVKKSGETES